MPTVPDVSEDIMVITTKDIVWTQGHSFAAGLILGKRKKKKKKEKVGLLATSECKIFAPTRNGCQLKPMDKEENTAAILA